MATKIELGQYWDKSWNPLKVEGGGYHCSKCSPGCLNCWAEKYNLRFHNKIPYDNRKVEYVLDEKVLFQAKRWRKRKRVFVCDLCDIGHPDIPNSFLRRIFWYCWYAPQHTYLFLTKRPERFAGRGLCSNCGHLAPIDGVCDNCGVTEKDMVERGFGNFPRKFHDNIHFGVSICTPDELWKAEELAKILAAVRFVSFEPLLADMGKLDCLWKFRKIGKVLKPHIDWVVLGGESGPGARPMHPDWARSVRDQCKEAGVPFFMKQMSKREPIPKDLQIRELIWQENKGK